MSNAILLDNDIVLKICGYDLLTELKECFVTESQSLVILGVARYVVRNAIAKRQAVNDKSGTLSRFQALLESVEELEPTDDEVALAAKLEAYAQESSAVSLDSGESQLLAVLIVRTACLIITGDKRAIRAIEPALCDIGYLTKVQNKVACLEQLMAAFVRRYGANAIQPRICREASIDSAMTICFRCVSGIYDDEVIADALSSYVNDVRTDAPSVLVNTNDLRSVIS